MPDQTAAPRATELTGDHGRTTIADVVVAKVAGLAAREIPGVHELLTQGVSGTIAGLAQRVAGGDTRAHGVRVEVGEHEATVDLRVTVEYGVSIPQVAEAVRRNIIDRVGGMTGLIVREVNIDVTDLHFPDEEPAPGQPGVSRAA
ncbi:MAG TPA: Asp23/Gls24 family envelope stress response protein [Gemmatimonadales bacterium]|nr:Asp23/Gls24 family envelope stress response protein [Gemmatimonadales bacterium]